jgi:hypothetical protein
MEALWEPQLPISDPQAARSRTLSLAHRMNGSPVRVRASALKKCLQSNTRLSGARRASSPALGVKPDDPFMTQTNRAGATGYLLALSRSTIARMASSRRASQLHQWSGKHWPRWGHCGGWTMDVTGSAFPAICGQNGKMATYQRVMRVASAEGRIGRRGSIDSRRSYGGKTT